ncbi:MAG: hypothetical protein DWQ05_12305 [Calditrichaeota bacterium]|nr:MAG: hypothetical protein DWQ05_12305 [Calditrichota bacterium]
MFRACLKISFLFLFFTAFFQSEKLLEWETQLNNLEADYFNSARQTNLLSDKVDSLGLAINNLKKKSGFLNERVLAQLLARSHNVANQLAASRDTTRLKLIRLTSGSQLLQENVEKFSSQLSFRLLEAENRKDANAQQTIISSLRQARQLLQRCRQYTTRSLVFQGLMAVSIDSTDTPESLRQKSDFILDQADRLRRQTAKLLEKQKSLQGELRMRNRIANFFDDLALTDPQREVANTDQGRTQENVTFGGDFDKTRSEVGNNLNDSFSFLGSSMQSVDDMKWFSNIENLESGQIERWIEIIDNQQATWLVQADSLENRAEVLQNLIKFQREQF